MTVDFTNPENHFRVYETLEEVDGVRRKLIAIGRLYSKPRVIQMPTNYRAGWVTVANIHDSTQVCHVLPEANIEGAAYGFPVRPYNHLSLFCDGALTIVPPIGRDVKVSVWASIAPVMVGHQPPHVIQWKTIPPVSFKGESKISPPVDDLHGGVWVKADKRNGCDVFVGDPETRKVGGLPLAPGETTFLDGNGWVWGRTENPEESCTVHIIRGEIGFKWQHPGAFPLGDEDFGI